MDQIRTRKSFGNLKAAGGGDATQSQLEAFEDFRRRHSKQNRDVVMDNAQRKLALKELQDQIIALRIEVLQVRSKNAQLEKQLEKARETQAGPNANIAIRALDQILHAVPALSALRDVLSNPTEPITSKKQSTEPSFTIAGPSAPRIIDREDKGRLVAIEEDWEDCEDQPVITSAIPPATVPLPPSPISPAYSSPSPRKRKSPKKKPQKRRRESGLVQMHQASPPPESSPPRTAKSIPIMPPIPAEPVSAPVASSSKTPYRARAVPIPSSEQKNTGNEDAGGRGRRSRASVVNYKEPSLHKKMRKPDGLSAEDALRVGAGRASLALDAVSPATSPLPPVQEDASSQRSTSQRSNPGEGGVRRKSIIPRSKTVPAASVIGPDDDDDELPEIEDMLHIEIEPRIEVARGGSSKYMEIPHVSEHSSNPSSSSSSSGPEGLFSPTPMRMSPSLIPSLTVIPGSTKSTATAPGRPAIAPPRITTSAPVRVTKVPVSAMPAAKMVSTSGRKIIPSAKLAHSGSLGRIAPSGSRGALKDLRDN